MELFLIAQLVKNLPAMQETQVRFLGCEDPLEKDRPPTSVFLGFPGGSASKESSCNVGDPGSILGSGSSSGEGRLPIPVFLGFPGISDGKESVCNVGDLGSFPGLGRSPEGGRGNLLQ